MNTVDAKILYEIALQRLMQTEKELVEALALYNQAMLKVQELENKINKDEKGE